MSENRKVSGAAALLILLAIASFATAAITIQNITEWRIYAKDAPIKKEKGKDIITSNYFTTNVYIDTTGTYNKTVIELTGFRGDPTYYEEVIQICNRDNRPYEVKLVYEGAWEGEWSHVAYVKLWLDKQPTGGVEIKSGVTQATVGPVTITSNACVPVSAEILVTPNAPTDQLLVKLQIDVVSTTNPSSP